MKADALVAEPMRMQETGCGWCLLPGQQSLYFAMALVPTADSSPMAEITETCGDTATNSSHSRLTSRPPVSPGLNNTHQEIVTGFKLGLDFPADVAVRDTQVLSDVAVVAHQGHVVVSDVDQLGR